MFGIILYILSFTLVFISSYQLTSMISKKNEVSGLIYQPILMFSQVVLTFEIMSLFSGINALNTILMNIIMLLIVSYVWKKQGSPKWKIEKQEIGKFFGRLKNSLKLDKSLIFLLVCWLVFIVVSLALSILMPVTSGDGKVYHAARSFFYVAQGNLNHFVINDIRALCLPINSEILYSWIIVFTKKDVLLACYSFVGYILSIIAIFNILGMMQISYRKRLWAIIILSSFASVLVQASSTETDIIIAGLISSSIYLYWLGLKEDRKIPIYMSALSYALAIGTKTPSIIMIPSVAIMLIYLSIRYKRFKPMIEFLVYGVLNFVVFSSYNYILNYIDYGDIAGPESFMVVSKNYDGIKGACANFIKYIFMFFDFTGLKWPDYIMPDLLKMKEGVLGFFGLAGMQDGLYTTDKYFQRSLIEQRMGAGILGFLVFLPCWIKGLFNIFSKNKTKKSIFVFSLMFLVNLVVISILLSYMSYSVRFLMSFMVISSPILVMSYMSNKNILKYIVILFSMFYLVCVSTHIWVRPIFKITKMLKETHSISKLREQAVCRNFFVYEDLRVECMVRHHIKQYPKSTKFLYFPETGTNYVGLGKLMLEGYKIDIGMPEHLSFENEKLTDKYDVIIIPSGPQRSTVFSDYEARKDDSITNEETKVVKFFKKRQYDCIYVYNNRIPKYNKNGEMMQPHSSLCFLTPKHIEKRGYNMSRVVGLLGEYDGYASNYFFFLEKK